MFLTLSPDDNFKNSGKQRDQVDFFSTIPSGLLLKPNTNVALHSASWKVIQGITIPSGSYSISVMGHTFNISIVGQTFQEPPTGSSDTAGSKCADYLNQVWKTAMTQGIGIVMKDGTVGNNTLYPAWARFGNEYGTNHSIGWEFDTTGIDFAFEMKYHQDNNYDTQSKVICSGLSAKNNVFTKSNSYVNVLPIDASLGGGQYAYQMRPTATKSNNVWNDNIFIGRDYAFVCDGYANGGVGEYGEMIFKWRDPANPTANRGAVGLAVKSLNDTYSISSRYVKCVLDLQTGIPPKVRETTQDTNSNITFSVAPPNVEDGDLYRIRMNASAYPFTSPEQFLYSVSKDDGNTWVDFQITPGQDRYQSYEMSARNEYLSPFFKAYTEFNGANEYKIVDWSATIVPTRDFYSGSGFDYRFDGYPNEVKFNPNSLSSVFDIKGFDSETGAGKSDGGVVNNINTSTSGVYVNLPTLGIKSITSAVERNVIGMLPIGEMSDGTNGMGSINGLQFNQVYNLIYLDMNNQDEREHNQIRVQLLDHNGNFLTNITDVSINLCVKPSSM